MRKAGDPIGATEMNIVLQETLNPHREGFAIRYGNTEFRTGDRVMQMKNDYSKNVFNGDVGKIVSVDASNKSAMIFFNGVEVEYTDEDFEDDSDADDPYFLAEDGEDDLRIRHVHLAAVCLYVYLSHKISQR